MLTGEITRKGSKEEPPLKGLHIGRLCPGRSWGRRKGFHTSFRGLFSAKIASHVKYPQMTINLYI